MTDEGPINEEPYQRFAQADDAGKKETVVAKYSVAIEVDGGQHDESGTDARRTVYLESQGWKVMRFWNDEVLGNIEGVYETILRVLQERTNQIEK